MGPQGWPAYWQWLACVWPCFFTFTSLHLSFQAIRSSRVSDSKPHGGSRTGHWSQRTWSKKRGCHAASPRSARISAINSIQLTMHPVGIRALISIMCGSPALHHCALPDPLASKSAGSVRMENLRLWLVVAFFVGTAVYAIVVMAINPV